MNYRIIAAALLGVLLASCSSKGSSLIPSTNSRVHRASTASASGSPTVVQETSGSPGQGVPITLSFPTAPAVGDALLVFFHNNGTSSGAAITYTAPTGWTQIDIDSSHAYNAYESFYHVVAAGETNSYVFTPSCECRTTVWVAAEYSGVNTTSPIDRHGYTVISPPATSWTTPSETPSQANDLAVVTLMPLSSTGTWSNAAGWTVDTTTGVWPSELMHQVQTGVSAVSESSTLSGGSTSYGGYASIVLLKGQQSWVTWGDNGPNRNSYNANETTLSESNIGSLVTTPEWTFTNTANGGGGFIVDEPIVVANVSTATQGQVDALYIGDEHADLFAINAGTGALLWSAKKLTESVACGDFPDGVYGIGGTPVFDSATNRVYVVDGQENLYGFDAASGSQKVGPVPMETDGFAADHTYGALTYDPAAHNLYVERAAHCGNPNTGGITEYNTVTGAVNVFYAGGTPPSTSNFSGVWGPGGVSADPRYPSVSDFYFGTGDGTLNTTNPTSYGQSVVRLNTSLKVVGFQTPVTAPQSDDQDFGDTPLVVHPSNGCGTMLVAQNKNANLYVYSNVDAITGGVIAGPTQSLAIGTGSAGGTNLATPAYDPNTNLVFVPNGSDGLYSHGLLAFTVTGSCTLSLAWNKVIGPDAVEDGPPAPPTVVKGADGKTMVFYSDGPGTSGCTGIGGGCSPKSDIYIFDAASGALLKTFQAPSQVEAAPVVVNGHLYLAGFSGTSESAAVYCYGL
jgi:hypothetical protein